MNSIWGWVRDLLAGIGLIAVVLWAWYSLDGKGSMPNGAHATVVDQTQPLVRDIRRSLDAGDFSAVCGMATAGTEQARERKVPMEQYRHWVNLRNHACMLGLKSEMRKSLDALEKAQ